MPGLSLADTLKAISNVAPEDELDPEADGTQRAAGDERQEARSHYLDIGSSSLRLSKHIEQDPRYSGKAVSRDSLLQGALASPDDRSQRSDSEEGSDAQSESSAGSIEEEQVAEASEDPEAPLDPSTSTSLEQDERAMLDQLKMAASADIEKGRDVRKQLALWDTLLEGRIRLQKVLTLLSTLPHPSAHESFRLKNEEDLESTLAALEKLSGSLFTMREKLLAANSTVQVPARKRQKRDPFDLDLALSDLESLDQTYQPYLRATIVKWSDKVTAASARNRFLDRDTWAQIDQTISNDGEKLVARTRRSRTGDNGNRGAIEDPETFDDGDFYQQLLKDVVESRSLDLDDGILASLRSAGSDRSKRRKVVDTKASKGRKLRYHVHEKLVHFMAPQPQPMPEGGQAWQDEQIKELFSSLLGRAVPHIPAENAPDAATGLLRIFG